MTIATPNYNEKLKYVMRWLLVGIAVLAMINIALYNGTVALRRAVTRSTNEVEQLKTANAQLKNDYYTLLDTRTLVAAAERLGYVRDTNPSYLTFRADGSAAQDGPVLSLPNGPSVSLRP